MAAKKPRTVSPGETHSHKVQRWVDLLAALLCHRTPLSLEELERHVPEYAASKKKTGDKRKQASNLNRMFERDKKELRAFGVVIETVTTGDGMTASRYHLVTRDFLMPLMRATDHGPHTTMRSQGLLGIAVSPDELDVVQQAAVRVRQLGDDSLARAADTAVRKLAFDLAALDPNSTGHVVLQTPVVSQALLQQLGDAVRRSKCVTFSYTSMERDATATRTVQPYGLAFTSGHWYLIAPADHESLVKHYRVDRIVQLTVNSIQPAVADFEIPSEFSLRAHAASRHAWELGDGDSLEVTVRFAGKSGTVTQAKALGTKVAGAPDLATFRVRRTASFVRWLLTLRGGAVPVSPPDIVQAWQHAIRDTMAVYTAASQ